MLVSDATFLGHLLAEVAALVTWLHDEQGYRTVVLAGEDEAALVALLATVVLPLSTPACFRGRRRPRCGPGHHDGLA